MNERELSHFTFLPLILTYFCPLQAKANCIINSKGPRGLSTATTASEWQCVVMEKNVSLHTYTCFLYILIDYIESIHYILLIFFWMIVFSAWWFILLLSIHICFLGVYTVEPMRDMSWAVLTQGVLFLYHFIVLQPLGIVSFLLFFSF